MTRKRLLYSYVLNYELKFEKRAISRKIENDYLAGEEKKKKFIARKCIMREKVVNSLFSLPPSPLIRTSNSRSLEAFFLVVMHSSIPLKAIIFAFHLLQIFSFPKVQYRLVS